MITRRTQAERSALSESRMLRAAIRLIAKQGYSKTTLAQIGEASGYSRGLASHRFGSKEGLLQALVAGSAGRFFEDQVLPAIKGHAGLEALSVMVDTYLNELVVREERLRAIYVLMGEALGPVPEIRDVFVKLNNAFRDSARASIEEGIKDGELRADLDPVVESALFVGMLRGVAMQWVTEPGCFDLAAVRASLHDSLARHLAAGGSPSARAQRTGA